MEDFQLAVFKGTYRHKLDAKGRLPVPAAFRRSILEARGHAVVVTVLDQCLAAYPPSEWERLEAQLRELPAFSRPVKALTRLLTSRAADCELDVQGRILLPAALRQAIGLTDAAVVIGVLNRFEVWNPETWEGFVRESERLLEDAALDVQWPLPPVPGPSSRPSGDPSASVRPQGKSRR